MTATIVGLRDSDFARVRDALPGLDLRQSDASRRAGPLTGTVVVLARFSPHCIQDRIRREGRQMVLHRGGVTTLIERLREIAGVRG